jgi:hypothetical protein
MLLACALVATPSHAQDVSDPADGDQLHYLVSLDSYLRLFQRAATPGPAGALVVTETRAPVYQYALLRVDDLDAPWREDSLDVEIAGWGSVEPGEIDQDVRRIDGDIAVMSIRQRVGPTQVTFGRQLRVGGAARLARFDGASAGARAPFGLGADIYGGFVVLPRWDARPGYQLLGSTADSMVRDPSALEAPSRDEAWLVGGRVHYQRPGVVEVGVSAHEQQTRGGVDRREIGLDLRAVPHDAVSLTGQGNVDADSLHISDARMVVDVEPIEALTISAEALHVTPSLLLSRQSVLSVFSLDAFDEFGGAVGVRPIDDLDLRADGYIAFFEDGRRGVRSHVEARMRLDRRDRITLSLRYGRLVETDNGYHAMRSALGYSPIAPLMLTGEIYGYFYDELVLGVPVSVVGASTAQWRFARWIALMVGGSMARTPYADIDAQAIARLSLSFERHSSVEAP